MFLISFASAAVTTTLNSPADEGIVYDNPVTFNASAEVTGGATLTNMSLFTNQSGSWEIDETIQNIFRWNNGSSDVTNDPDAFQTQKNFFDENDETFAYKTVANTVVHYYLGKTFDEQIIGNIKIKV